MLRLIQSGICHLEILSQAFTDSRVDTIGINGSYFFTFLLMAVLIPHRYTYC
ncbi:hypothetical protein D3C73_1563390 [compost metagenome]